MRVKYTSISIPDKLVSAIDAYIKEHPELDLRSRAQAVDFALRMFLLNRPTRRIL